MIHLSVAVGRFVETLLWAILRAGLSLFGVAALVIIALVAVIALFRRRRSRR